MPHLFHTLIISLLLTPEVVRGDGFFGVNDFVDIFVDKLSFLGQLFPDTDNATDASNNLLLVEEANRAFSSVGSSPVALQQQQAQTESNSNVEKKFNASILPYTTSTTRAVVANINDTITSNLNGFDNDDDPAVTPVVNDVANNRRDADAAQKTSNEGEDGTAAKVAVISDSDSDSDDVDDVETAAEAQEQISRPSEFGLVPPLVPRRATFAPAALLPTAAPSSIYELLESLSPATTSTPVESLPSMTANATDLNNTQSSSLLIALPEEDALPLLANETQAFLDSLLNGDNQNTTPSSSAETLPPTDVYDTAEIPLEVVVDAGLRSALDNQSTSSPETIESSSLNATTVLKADLNETAIIPPAVTKIVAADDSSAEFLNFSATSLPTTTKQPVSLTTAPIQTFTSAITTTQKAESSTVIAQVENMATTTAYTHATTTTSATTLLPLTKFIIPIDLVTATQRRMLCGDPPLINNSYAPNVTCSGRVHACIAQYFCVGGYELVGAETIACQQQQQEHKWQNPPTCRKPAVATTPAKSAQLLATTTERSTKFLNESEKLAMCGPPPRINNAISYVLCTSPQTCVAHYICVNNTILNDPITKTKCSVLNGNWVQPAVPLACLSVEEAAAQKRRRTTTATTTTTSTSTASPPPSSTSGNSPPATKTEASSSATKTTNSVIPYTPIRYKPPPTAALQRQSATDETRASALAEKVVRICGEPPQIQHAEMRLVCGSVSCTAMYFCDRNYAHGKGGRKLKCTMDETATFRSAEVATAVARWPDSSILARCVPRISAGGVLDVAVSPFRSSLSVATTPCGNIPSVANARLVSHKHSTVRFACLPGYALTDISTETLQCIQGTNKWNNGLIQCVRLEELEMTNKQNLRYRITDLQAKGMPCEPGYRPCHNGICVLRSKFCDTIYDCSDQSDELDCYAFRTPWEYTSTTQRNAANASPPTISSRENVAPPPQSSSSSSSSSSQYAYQVMSISREQFSNYRSCESSPFTRTTAACVGYYMPYYTFDHELADCRRINDYGCPTTLNMFRDMASCRAHCIAPQLRQYAVGNEHCLLAPVTGACPPAASADDEPRYAQRWYYDVEHQKCRTFLFSGCSGNANKFETETFCLSNCSGVHLEGDKPLRSRLPLVEIPVLSQSRQPSVAVESQSRSRYQTAATTTTTTSATTYSSSKFGNDVCPPRPVLKDAEVWYERELSRANAVDNYNRAVASSSNLDAGTQHSTVDKFGTRLTYRCLPPAANNHINNDINVNGYKSLTESFSIECIRSANGDLLWQKPEENYCGATVADMRNKCSNPPAVDNATSRIALNTEANRFEVYYRCDDGYYFASYANYSEPFCKDGFWQHGELPRCRLLMWAKGVIGGSVYGDDDDATVLSTNAVDGPTPPETAAAANVSNLGELAVLMQFNFDRLFRKLGQVDRDFLRGIWSDADSTASKTGGKQIGSNSGKGSESLRLLKYHPRQVDQLKHNNNNNEIKDADELQGKELNDAASKRQLKWLRNRILQLRRVVSAKSFNA